MPAWLTLSSRGQTDVALLPTRMTESYAAMRPIVEARGYRSKLSGPSASHRGAPAYPPRRRLARTGQGGREATQALGIAIPLTLLGRADEVIE